jgi:hypothetical protein
MNEGRAYGRKYRGDEAKSPRAEKLQSDKEAELQRERTAD